MAKLRKIVVTGALGHIGSRLIRDFPAAFPNAEIVLVDNLSTNRYCSLFNLPAAGHYRFVEADVLKADLPTIFSDAQTVIHLAAITDAAGSFTMHEQVERVNFEGTLKVAEACLQTGAALIFPSTTSVYGTQKQIVDEDCSPSDLQPQSPYAESKLKAEQHLTELGKTKGLRFVACRFGTIFGVSTGMRFHTAINKFVWQAVMGQPITVWRTAMDQMRPYLDLGDAIRAMQFIIDTNRFDGRIYNVLTVNVTVSLIVDIIRTFIPDLRVELVDSRIMNQLSYTVACEKFQSLGFHFNGDLERGISEMIQLLRAARGN